MSLTKNLDIVGLVNRLRRFKKEWAKSVSANGAMVNNHDALRLRSYLAALNSYIDFFQAQPVPDVPEYHGDRSYDLGEAELFGSVENESVNDMMELWNILEIELMNCQSSRTSFGLLDHDEKRSRAMLGRMQRLLTEYMEQALPLDLPESSPMRDSVSDGQLGINPTV